jgi:hypothetical protein
MGSSRAASSLPSGFRRQGGSKDNERPMNSERQKREEEIERLMRGTPLSREADVAFQEEVRKAASAIVEEERSRIEKSERTERRDRSLSPMKIGLWLLVAGVGLAFSIPSAGALLIFCGLAAIVWATFLKRPKA